MSNCMRNNRRVGEERLNLIGLRALPNRYYTPARMQRIAQARAMEWVYRNSGINPYSLAANNGWTDGWTPNLNNTMQDFGFRIDG